MKERFEDAEIRVAQFRPFDTLGRVGDQRLKGFHENEPDMHSGAVSPSSCSFSPHSNFYLDTDCIDVNIMSIKQTKLNMKITFIIARFLLGLIFLTFGL